MSARDYEFPRVPKELEKDYRAAHRALQDLVPNKSSFVREDGLDVLKVISQIPMMTEKVEQAIIAYLGPEIAWRTDHGEDKWNWTVAGISLDETEEKLDFGVKLKEPAFHGECGDWADSRLDLAAQAYKRETTYNAPGKAGFWLLMLAPFSSDPAVRDEWWSYYGRLAGFVILYDRHDDGTYESVGHIWTARAWRRMGIAKHLLTEAKARFKFRKIEGPLTLDGAALLKAHPELSGDQRDAS